MDIQVIVFGALTRMAQALVAASPTIFVGWLVAAIFERILGREEPTGSLAAIPGDSFPKLGFWECSFRSVRSESSR